MLEAMKPIVSIKVSIVETVKPSKAQARIHRWSAVHRHSGNWAWRQSAARSRLGTRITVPAHLRHRNRGCENASYHAAKENEFSPVHSVIGF
jgi:hypothetical protein